MLISLVTMCTLLIFTFFISNYFVEISTCLTLIIGFSHYRLSKTPFFCDGGASCFFFLSLLPYDFLLSFHQANKTKSFPSFNWILKPCLVNSRKWFTNIYHENNCCGYQKIWFVFIGSRPSRSRCVIMCRLKPKAMSFTRIRAHK